jgi:hypothetical protein
MTEQEVEQFIATIEESEDLSALSKVATAVAARIQAIIKQRHQAPQ